MIFSDKDVKQIKNHGLTLDEVNAQMEKFQYGFPFVNIVKPATDTDGVISCSETDCEKYIKRYESYALSHKVVKFVPASGAATRMFKDLFDFLATNMPNTVSRITVSNITLFAFWDDLKQYLPRNASDTNIVQCLITDSGLNYGNQPKGLIAFHKYPESVKTPVEEQLDECGEYATSMDSVNIHFTVSPEHRHDFEVLLNRVIPMCEGKYATKYNVSVSEQKKSTDTIAMQLDRNPFRNPDGSLLFRPAGHGALIENLNEIDADLIFIKNIDNVTLEPLRGNTIKYKKVLAGILIDIQEQIFDFMTYIDSADNVDIDRVHEFVTTKIGIKLSNKISLAEYRKILNRPLRVCGVVKNTGAHGGGPFWVRENIGMDTLQIVESNQIAPESRDIMNTSEYFNPVDLVCGVKDYHNNKFNLTEFIDNNAGFISEKSKNGVALLAMERPGLWNGAMAKWNTVFVSVPADTFTPVKVVTDLLSPEHLMK
jgi:hypothetical protein